MKIGIVLPSVPGYSETFFRSKIKGLQANGFEIVLFVNNFTTQASLNCKIVASPTFSKNKLKSIFISFYLLVKVLVYDFSNVKRLFLLNQKDNLSFSKNIKNIVINSHLINQKLDWLHFGFGTMAIDRENVATAIGAKMAVSFRGFDIGIYPLKHPNCYTRIWEKVDRIHVISDDIKSLVTNNGFNNVDRIIKINPAIEVQYFMSKSKIRVPNRILCVARLNWKKGLEYTLQALKILKEKGFEFQFNIVGDGFEIERLKFASYQLGLSDNVFFLGKFSSLEVKEEMEKATYYIQYSLQEGFCNSVLEAQAMGLVCLVSDAEGLSENVLNNQTGFVIPKRNPELLANKIIETILLSDQEKESIISNAVNRVNNNFTIENQIKQFVEFYQK